MILKLGAVALAVVLLLGGIEVWRRKERRIGAMQEQLKSVTQDAMEARHRADSLALAFRVDTVETFQRVTVTRTLLDTLSLTDTLRVREIIRQTDTLIVRLQDTCRLCALALAASDSSRRADSLRFTLRLRLVESKDQSWLRRHLGVVVGPGLLYGEGGTVRAGLTIGAGIRVF